MIKANVLRIRKYNFSVNYQQIFVFRYTPTDIITSVGTEGASAPTTFWKSSEWEEINNFVPFWINSVHWWSYSKTMQFNLLKYIGNTLIICDKGFLFQGRIIYERLAKLYWCPQKVCNDYGAIYCSHIVIALSTLSLIISLLRSIVVFCRYIVRQKKLLR